MQDDDPAPRQAEVSAAPYGTVQRLPPEGSGCLTAFIVLSMLLLALVVSCSLAFTPEEDHRIEHEEFPSPNGKRLAIVDSYVTGWTGTTHYDTLIISENGTQTVIGDFWVISPHWLSDSKLVVTLERARIPDIKAHSRTVEIVMHLGEGSRVEAERRMLQHNEEVTTKPEDVFLSKYFCKRAPDYWTYDRSFWAWARKATDNGDPDPGSWISKYYPVDCSTLSDSSPSTGLQ